LTRKVVGVFVRFSIRPLQFESDELSQKLVSVSSSSTGDDINDVSDPRLTTYAPYKLQTPSKLTGSFAYVFKRGLISIDYAIKDYSKTKFKPESDSITKA
jgi:hypothetical protein